MTAPTVAGTYATYAVLDAAYRAALGRTALIVARTLQVYWTSVDGADLTRTSADWLARSVDAVLRGQTTASALANVYTERVRALSLPAAPVFTPPPTRPPNVEQVRTSMEFVAIKRTARDLYAVENSLNQWGEDPEFAREQAESNQRTLDGRRQQLMSEAIKRAAGAAVRHVTTAGRDQLEDNVNADDLAMGWVRTTKAGCCYFCAMLASRGIVYKGDSFEESNKRFEGIGGQKVHDNCGCGLRPVYTASDPLPDRVEELDKMWAGHAARYSGPEAIRQFRRVYEASPLAVRAE